MARSERIAETSDEVITESVPQVLARQLAAHGGRPAMYWEDGQELACLTYAGLARAAHPGVASAVVVGLDDERLGDWVAGVVIRAPGREVTGEELAGPGY
jgi:hypothetical protein